MGTTSNEGLVYPDSTSSTELWTHFLTLANGVDTRLALRKARGLMATPVATSSAGTTTSGTTDTRDAAMGNYVFTAVASRRYRVSVLGLRIGGTVSGDTFNIRVRDGGASTPTAASLQIAQSSKRVPVNGGAGEETVLVSQTFTATAGTHTLSVFVQRTAGTGTGTIGATAREMFVEDIGAA